MVRRSTPRGKKSNSISFKDQPAFHLTEAILAAWKRDVQEVGASPLFLIIPTSRDIKALRAAPQADIPRLDLALEKFCRREGIPFLNLSSPMVKWQGDFNSLWLEDGHFSPEGHAWVARELFDALRSKDLLPRQESRGW